MDNHKNRQPSQWQYIALALLPITFIGVAIAARRGSQKAAIASWIGIGVWVVGAVIAIALFP